MNKICVIIPWYGKIPTFFPFFLKGLELNQDVLDVLFFTDEKIPFSTPKNFKRIELPWGELVQRIKQVVSDKANIKSAYKLCDFKPMYGKIFKAQIENYEFWGYGDIDLIYGDLNKYFPWDGIDN